ncbi:MAG: TIGR03560 family F420-dependent LLM class oxidoreductase [Dehalococcoidia bacterium]|nr:TIGR03560 family F420-dependent LLM class oxidoreductase [Dehalococcoidia bacterium]MDW8120504.1 TIGR03560 family F420-dependent LLM class oxidoreductase [Chloroflexota bacterium]
MVRFRSRFGIQQPSFAWGVPAEGIFPALMTLAHTADASGYDSFWLMDHFIQIPFVAPPDTPMPEAWTTLGALASVTRQVRLGTLVSGTPYRNPALLAKMGATLDLVSGGRLFMGIGAGWYETEFHAYGWPFPPRSERARRLAEAVQVLLALWTQERATFQGRYYQVKDALCAPKPLQRPLPPLLIGGGGEQVTLRLVARYATACNLFGDPPTIRHKLGVLARHCEAVGRDPSTVLKTRLGGLLLAPTEREVARLAQRLGRAVDFTSWNPLMGTPAQVTERCARLLEAGLDYLIFSFPDAPAVEGMVLFAQEVAPALGLDKPLDLPWPPQGVALPPPTR